jgi:hypothetical protein
VAASRLQDYGLFIRRKTHKGIWLKHTRTLSDYPELFAHRKVRPVELMLKPRSVTIVLPEKQRCGVRRLIHFIFHIMFRLVS